MLWGIPSLVTVLLNSAARALPQLEGDLGDLLQLGPELDEPEPESGPNLKPLLAPTTHRTEQVSTLPRDVHTTSAFSQLTTHAAQLTVTVAITGVPPHPYLTPTESPISRPLTTPTSARNDTYTSVISISNVSLNTATTSSPSPTPAADSGLSQGQAIDWRVIGIAVIAISAVGTMILLVVFFDQWWGFLCDVCGGRRRQRGGGKEELVPDWERGTWEYKVEVDNLNLPIYPSFGSPPAWRMQKGAGAATHARQWKVDIDQRPNQNTSPDCSAFSAARPSEDNSQVLGTQRVPCGILDEVTINRFHSPLSRSNTQRSATSEDAYDGLAT